eukprot:1204423-Amphidinium_carterae.1
MTPPCGKVRETELPQVPLGTPSGRTVSGNLCSGSHSLMRRSLNLLGLSFAGHTMIVTIESPQRPTK